MTDLPDYVIQPPDVLTISAINLIPKQPYYLQPLDTVRVQIANLGDDTPFAAELTVGIDGTLPLGAPVDYVDGRYSPVAAAGKTIQHLQVEIQARVRRIIADPQVTVALTGIAPVQEIAGDHLVAPDGKITLGSYGRVPVSGLTIDQARETIELFLSNVFEDPSVSVDVAGYNSSTYYIVTQGAGLGDKVIRLPVTGNDTVLSAISEVEGLPATSSAKMWIARPGCGEEPNRRLWVDWQAITQNGDAATNYQLMPGDRLYIAENKLVALDTALAKIISPIERVLGVTLLGTQTVRQIVFFDQIGQNGTGTGTGF